MALERILIVGLGNPGAKYERTRHNAGFWVVDALAKAWHASLRPQARMHAEVGDAQAPGGQRVVLAKPQTFMNASGQSVRALVDFYKLPLDAVLVIHDELDLPAGVLRLKRGGGPGGHNGLKDISRHCGAEYLRLRVGVGHPGRKEAVLGHVLSAAGVAEQAELDRAVDRAVEAIEDGLRGGWDGATQRLHTV